MDETSPAVKLRANVVLLVVVAIVSLSIGLYGSAVWLIAAGRSVPGELWLAAGSASGALITLLVNTKHEPTAADPSPVQVVNQPDQPVPVDSGATDESLDPDDAAEPQPIGDTGQGELTQIVVIAAGIFLGLLLFALTGIQISPP